MKLRMSLNLRCQCTGGGGAMQAQLVEELLSQLPKETRAQVLRSNAEHAEHAEVF
jgi:hypothetical protein